MSYQKLLQFEGAFFLAVVEADNSMNLPELGQ
jgi:hypothetical protein